MQLKRHTAIAIKTLVACAKARGQLVQTATLARWCEASHLHTAQVTSQLSRIGWLESYRGRAGGVALANGMETLSIGDIVRALQGTYGNHSASGGLETLFYEAECSSLAYLDRFTVADLASRHEHCPS